MDRPAVVHMVQQLPLKGSDSSSPAAPREPASNAVVNKCEAVKRSEMNYLLTHAC